MFNSLEMFSEILFYFFLLLFEELLLFASIFNLVWVHFFLLNDE